MSDEAVFDKNSGISLEEQKEILARINGIPEKSRRSLSKGEKSVYKAKKNGAFFPLAVNIAALAVLLCGALSLFFFNSRTDAKIRTGAVTGPAFTNVYQGLSKELEAAVRELELLTSEQEKISYVDALISGGLASVGDLIKKGEYDQGILTIAELRQFVNNNSFASSSAFQSRRIFYSQSLDFAEALIHDARRQLDLLSEISALEKNIGETRTTIAALETDKNDLSGTINAKNSEISALETRRDSLIQDAASKDRTIASLNAEKTALASQVSDLTSRVAERDRRITELDNQLTTLRQRVQELILLQQELLQE